ncbi:MAG: hypothetical protein H7067_06775 [Burkholderiales bacterium]|nr:hypothetical protein [Opitutaceae bacterium]
MSQSFHEATLEFKFPTTWHVCRPEKAGYYKNQFQSFCDFSADGGCKEVDFLAFDPANGVLWCIEVKDYRSNPRNKTNSLAEEVALKVRDVLALLPAALAKDTSPEIASRLQVGQFARLCLQNLTNIRVVLHCELPPSGTLKSSNPALFPTVSQLANYRADLARRLRTIDPRPQINSISEPLALPWSVNE